MPKNLNSSHWFFKQDLSPDRIARLILHILFLENSKSVTLIVCVCVCVWGGGGGGGGGGGVGGGGCSKKAPYITKARILKYTENFVTKKKKVFR